MLSLLAELDTDVWIGLTRMDSDEYRWLNGDVMTYMYCYTVVLIIYTVSAGMQCGLLENRVLAIVLSVLRSTLALATGRRSTA